MGKCTRFSPLASATLGHTLYSDSQRFSWDWGLAPTMVNCLFQPLYQRSFLLVPLSFPLSPPPLQGPVVFPGNHLPNKPMLLKSLSRGLHGRWGRGNPNQDSGETQGQDMGFLNLGRLWKAKEVGHGWSGPG